MTSVYPIIPAGPKPLYIMLPVFVILCLTFFMIAWTLYGTQRASVRLSSEGMSFHGDIWGWQTIPWTQLRTDDARIVNLADHPDLQPTSRRMGTGLPGYASGWFRLRNNEKALLFVTDRRRVVYIPTDLGYSILTSVAEPDALLQQLRTGAGGS